ncbi:MAG: phosphatidylglycerol lysyltransferase domain-containing protein, partial [Marmoricola sp.]
MSAPSTGVDDRLSKLVSISSDDPLAPFVLRPGKEYVFSPDGLAVIGYRVRFGVAVVGGDPVGDRSSWAACVDEFVALMKTKRKRIAVLAAGEEARELWVRFGLASVPIGRDVVVRPEQFNLVGRKFRNVRQAIQRTKNSGVTVETYLEANVPAEVLMALRTIVSETGRDTERGFSMILGHAFDGSQPESLVVVARDTAGRILGSHRYRRAGPADLSLDVPVRVNDSPNGLDERLIAEAVDWARKNGIERLSLAFAPFPDLYSNVHKNATER